MIDIHSLMYKFYMDKDTAGKIHWLRIALTSIEKYIYYYGRDGEKHMKGNFVNYFNMQNRDIHIFGIAY